MLQPIPWVRATSIWVRSSPSSWAVLRDVYKEEGPELPKGGRAGSYPVNQHKCKPGRRFWPDLLVTFAVVCPSGSRSLLAGAGSVFPCTHNKGTLQSAPALPLHWFSQAGDVFRGLIFNLTLLKKRTSSGYESLGDGCSRSSSFPDSVCVQPGRFSEGLDVKSRDVNPCEKPLARDDERHMMNIPLQAGELHCNHMVEGKQLSFEFLSSFLQKHTALGGSSHVQQ